MITQEQAREAEQHKQGERLGYRINEFCAMTKVSRVTVWRMAKTGKLRLAYLGDIPIIPVDEVRRLGLLLAEFA